MGTRGAIARLTDEGFSGRYHHWDSYPTGLGKTLWDAWHVYFQADTDAMLTYLIDQHPAGWSSINASDFSLPPGYDSGAAPACYCHGERNSVSHTVTHDNAAGSGCEWVYVFSGDMMTIFEARNRDDTRMVGLFGRGNPVAGWHLVADIDLAGDEPDWNAIEARE